MTSGGPRGTLSKNILLAGSFLERFHFEIARVGEWQHLLYTPMHHPKAKTTEHQSQARSGKLGWELG
jgi:hypothetical protein